MAEHVVGIRVEAGYILDPGSWVPFCSCGWKGVPVLREVTKPDMAKNISRLENTAEKAQAQAVEHQGGTLRVEKRPRVNRADRSKGMEQMFPEAG